MLKLIVLCVSVQLGACLMMTPTAEPDSLLEVLYTEGKAPRAAVCVPGDSGGVAGCPAVLWSRRWALARAACVDSFGAERPLSSAVVLLHQAPLACHDNVIGDDSAIPVIETFVQPSHEWDKDNEIVRSSLDVLLLLARPADVPRANRTLTAFRPPGMQPWLFYVLAQFPATWDDPPARPRTRFDLSQMAMTSSPARLLFTTVVLPLALVLLIFVVAVRFPRGADDDWPPYVSLPPELQPAPFAHLKDEEKPIEERMPAE